MMETVSSSGSGASAALGRRQLNGPSIPTPTTHENSMAAVGTAAEISVIGKSKDLVSTTRTDSGGKVTKPQKYQARDTKSLDYITRTMLAGGIAGITVSIHMKHFVMELN